MIPCYYADGSAVSEDEADMIMRAFGAVRARRRAGHQCRRGAPAAHPHRTLCEARRGW